MMRTGKAIMQPFDALTAAKYLLLAARGFIVGRDAVQNVPSLLADVISRVRKAEGPLASSGNGVNII